MTSKQANIVDSQLHTDKQTTKGTRLPYTPPRCVPIAIHHQTAVKTYTASKEGTRTISGVVTDYGPGS